MSGNIGTDTAINTLKRKIIASDKLIKNQNKFKDKVNELNSALKEKDKLLEEKSLEVERIKSELKKSQSEPIKVDASEKIKSEFLETKKEWDEQMKILRGINDEKSKKSQDLEAEVSKLKSKLSLYEKELKSKNDNIIKRELESQNLRQQIDDLLKKNREIEDDIKRGKHVEGIKNKFEEEKWKNLAEISQLKQEKFTLEQSNEELKEINGVLQKSNDEHEKNFERFETATKIKEHLEKDLEKRNKSIANLEKKLAQAHEANAKLKLKLKVKVLDKKETSGDVIDETVAREETSFNVSHEFEETLVDRINLSLNSTSTPKLSLFSFSRPNARFSIGKPKPPIRNKFKLKFHHAAKLVSDVPHVFNQAPKISDHFSVLTPNSHNSTKRKLAYEDVEDNERKRFKSNDSIISVHVGSSDKSFTKMGLKNVSPKKNSPRKKTKKLEVTINPEPQIKPLNPAISRSFVGAPVVQNQAKRKLDENDVNSSKMTQQFVPSLSSTTLEDSQRGVFSEPNPVKVRQAHVKPNQNKQLNNQTAPKYEPPKKAKKSGQGHPIFETIPQLLSPIKTPKASIPGEPASFPSPKHPQSNRSLFNERKVKPTTCSKEKAVVSQSISSSSSTSTTSSLSVRDRIKSASLAPVQVRIETNFLY